MASNSNEESDNIRKRDDRRCAMCNIYIRKSIGREKEIESEVEIEYAKQLSNKDIYIHDVICDSCRKRLAKYISSSKPKKVNVPATASSQDSNVSESFSQLTVTSSSQESTQSSVYTIKEQKVRATTELLIQRTIATHKYCFVCGYQKQTNNILVPLEARIQVYSKMNVFIPHGNRCCCTHLIKKRFYEDELNKINIFSTTSTVYIDELLQFLSQLSMKADETLLDTVAEFSMPEKKLKVFTGLTWENINYLKDQLTSLKNSCVRTATQAIVVFLFKMRSGNSNSLISTIFDIESEQQVSRFCQSVLLSFEKDLLPKHFGLENVDRNELIENQTSNMAKKLHPGKQLILIADGTYIRHEKSSNNEYQRKSYSGQKKVPLTKPFTICTTNGYVVDQLGPYLANKNDATILIEILEEKQNILQKLLRQGDIFILDRGFRDIKQKLENMGYIVLMPALKGSKSQLSTQESNETRFTTKLRWVVEAVHGVQKKKYRLLDHKLDNKMVKNTGSYCKISCYLNNLFGKRLDSDEDMQDEIFSAMQSRKNVENTLAVLVADKRWSRRKLPFKIITSDDLPDFPELTIKDLKILFTGTYQLKQTISYLAEMLDADNNLKIGYSKETNNILKLEVQSRHINRKQYKCFVEYKPNGIGYSSILRHCCDCANGNRTIGCCAHIAAIIYYLSHGRYLSKIIRPAEILSKMFLNDQIEVCIDEDSDNDE